MITTPHSRAARLRAAVVVVWLVAVIGVLPAFAPSASADQRTVTVATRNLAPFVITNGDTKSGFTIDVLEGIAKRVGWKLNYLDFPTVSEQLKAVAEGRADAAAAAVSITSARTQQFDFSQPILDGGLQILVPITAREPSSPGLAEFVKLLFSKAVLVWLVAALVITLIPAHILWLLERRHDDSMVSKSYFPGIFESFRWSLGALAGVADDSPRQSAARAITVVWGFVCIIFIAYYTATLTANITVGKFDAQINSPSDLIGKKVCTVANTTSASALKGFGVAFEGVPSIDDCYKGLQSAKFEAAVYDAPVLAYYVNREGRGAVELAGAVFQPEGYGIAFKNGSELRKQADTELLAMREDGEYAVIQQKWFGDASSGGG